MAFRNNNAMIEYCRTSACALSGCTAGIMGLTGLQGFGFYFCAVLGLWVRWIFTDCYYLSSELF